MKKLAVSIVLYSSDLALLHEVIVSLTDACRHASRVAPLACSLDLVNNNPDDPNRGAITALAESTGSDDLAISIVDSKVNGGYGAGNNISIRRHIDVDFHLVLNPDVLVKEAAITAALSYLELNPDVGMLTPKVVGLDGIQHYLCKQNPTLFDMFIRSVPSRLTSHIFHRRTAKYEMRDRDYLNVIRPIPYPTGCFMLFRRSVLDTIGGFDEGYFLHYEDADIGRQVSLISQTAYVPTVEVVHKWNRESHKSWRMRWITIKSGLRYWSKWGGVF